MDIVEIKQLIGRSLKINPILYDVPIRGTPEPDQTNGHKLIWKYVWIMPNPRAEDATRNSTVNYQSIPIRLASAPSRSSVSVSMKSVRGNPGNNFSFTWEDDQQTGEEMISRIEVLGNNRLSKKSSWSSSCKNSFVFDDSTILTDMYCPTTMFPTLTLSEGTRDEVTYKNFHVVIFEIAHPGTNSLKPTPELPKVGTQLGNVLLTNAKMLSKKDLVDMEIIVLVKGKIVETFKAHKAILAARSEVFLAMLQAPMKEGQFSSIEIVDFEPEIIRELLKYLYIGDMDLATYAVELFRCGDKYAINELMELCEAFMAENIQQIGWPSIFDLFNIFDKGLTVLRGKVAEYFKKNESSLKHSEDFQSAMKMYPEQFFALYLPLSPGFWGEVNKENKQ